MADVFLSYAHEDHDQAELLASAVGTKGLTAFWDRATPPGSIFDKVLEEELRAAKCVVVLWSQAAVRSDWVRSEALRGKDRGTLVPILIETGVEIPLAFQLIQAADLTDWDGGADDPRFVAVAEALVARVREPQAGPSGESGVGRPLAQPQSGTRARAWRQLRRTLAFGVVIGVSSALLPWGGLIPENADVLKSAAPLIVIGALVTAVAFAGWLAPHAKALSIASVASLLLLLALQLTAVCRVENYGGGRDAGDGSAATHRFLTGFALTDQGRRYAQSLGSSCSDLVRGAGDDRIRLIWGGTHVAAAVLYVGSFAGFVFFMLLALAGAEFGPTGRR